MANLTNWLSLLTPSGLPCKIKRLMWYSGCHSSQATVGDRDNVDFSPSVNLYKVRFLGTCIQNICRTYHAT